MTDTWWNRAKQVIAQKGMKRSKVALEAGISQTLLKTWLSGRIDHPRGDSLDRLAVAIGVDPLWLKEGIQKTDTNRQPLTLANDIMVAVPMLDVSTSAGDGSLIYEESVVEVWQFPKHILPYSTGSRNIIRVQGDSMEPLYQDGDMVMVDMGHTRPSPPGAYILSDGMSVILKRIEYNPSSSTLDIISTNPAYPKITLSLKDFEGDGSIYKILGRVIWRLNKPE